MNTAERAALEHENWIAYLSNVVRCTEVGRVHRESGTVAIRSDIPFDWFNQVLIERPDATPAGLLHVLEKGLGRGNGFVVRLREGVDDRFISTLTRTGFAAAGSATTTPGMVAFPIDREAIADAIAPRRLPGFEIRQVTDAIGIDDHRKVVTEGFGSPPAHSGRPAPGSSATRIALCTSATPAARQLRPGSAGAPGGRSGCTRSQRYRRRVGTATAPR